MCRMCRCRHSGWRSAPAAIAARSFDGTLQRGAHPGHHPGDLRVPPRAGHRRPALPRQGHARPLRPGAAHAPSRCSPPTASTTVHPGRRRLHADAGHLARHPRATTAAARRGLADGIVITPSHNPPAGRRLQVQPAQRRPGRHRRHRLDREPRQRPARATATAASSACPTRRRSRPRPRVGARLRHRLRRRPRRGHRHGRHPRGAAAHRRRSAGRRRGRLLGAASPSATGSTSTSSTDASIRRSPS